MLRYTPREARAIKLDGLSVAELKELQASAEKHAFAAEVDRMMKLIINSLYRNKEVSPIKKWRSIVLRGEGQDESVWFI